MSKNTNLSFLTDYITADITNGRIGINNASPTVAFDVTGVANFSSSVGIGNPSSIEGVLTIKGTSAQPPTSGTTANSLLQLVGSLGAELNIGSNTVAGGYGSYIQASDNNLAVPYPLNLQPNGGNVGIGTSSPSLNLSVQGLYGLPATSGVQGTGIFRVQDSASNIALDMGVIQNAGNWIQSGNKANSAVLPLALNPSGGNIGVGTSTPASAGGTYTSIDIRGTGGGALVMGTTATLMSYFYVDAGGLNVQTTGSIPFLFLPGGTERMRITSAGDLLISNTDGTGKIVVAGDDNAIILRSRNTSASSAYQFYITHSLGNVSIGNYRGTVNYNNSSDYRLKEDLKQFNGLNILSSINFYDFKWKQNQVRNYGIIAHEIQQVLPYVVEGKKDELFEDGSVKSQQVDLTKLIPILGKAIQELSAENTSLINRIEALENK